MLFAAPGKPVKIGWFAESDDEMDQDTVVLSTRLLHTNVRNRRNKTHISRHTESGGGWQGTRTEDECERESRWMRMFDRWNRMRRSNRSGVPRKRRHVSGFPFFNLKAFDSVHSPAGKRFQIIRLPGEMLCIRLHRYASRFLISGMSLRPVMADR